MKNRFLTAALAAAMMTGAGAASALAQDAMPQQMAPDSASVTDEQINSFVEATQGINTVIEQYQPQVETAESEEAAMQLQQQAQDEMVVVVEQTGLSVDEYNGIAAAAQGDPELAERIRTAAGVAPFEQ